MRALGLAPKKQAFQAAGIDKVAFAKTLGVDPEKEPGTFAFLSKALDHALPEPWSEQVDSKKRVFYWNPVSRQSSWQHPLAPTHKALVVAFRRVMQAEDQAAAIEGEIDAFQRQAEEEISKWRQSHSPEGTPYFYKLGTQLTRWDNPRDEVLTHMELRVRMLSELADELGRPKPKKRGKAGRSRSRERLEEAATRIQCLARRWLARRAVRRRRAAVRRMQCLARGFLGRRKARRRRELVAKGRPAGVDSKDQVKRFQSTAASHVADHQGLSASVVDLTGLVIPDEMALHLGMNLKDHIDAAAFAMMRPLFLRPLPDPWRVIRRRHGRTDFYHPGLREERRQHPLFGFFAEMLAFLRAHAKTNVPITEAMAAQIFREASPQVLRERLGVWEGPHEDAAVPGGVRFVLLVTGTDPACPLGGERRDDPRLEAASNTAARLAGWQHLWAGFAPAEPFPLLEGRLAALAAQLSESVVVAPGLAAEELLALIASRMPSPKAPPPRLSPEEEALQPVVVGLLGRAYGKALAVAADEEAARARRESAAAPSEAAGSSQDEPQEEEEYSDDAPEEDEFEEESSEEEEEAVSEDGEDSADGRSDAAGEGRGGDGAEAPDGVVTPPARAPRLFGQLGEEPKSGASSPASKRPPREVEGFLPFLRLESAADWAEHALRPLTPQPGDLQGRDEYHVPISPGALPPSGLQRLGFDRDFWTQPLPAPTATLELSVGTLACEAPGELNQPEAPAEPPPQAAADDDAPPVPASPKPAAPATPHVAQPPVGLDLPLSPKPSTRATRKREQFRIDAFASSLANSLVTFNKRCDSVEPPEDEVPWQVRKARTDESAPPQSSRNVLARAWMPPKRKAGEPVDPGANADVMVMEGAAARPPTPNYRQAGPPPHLDGAAPALAGTRLPYHLQRPNPRPSSAAPAAPLRPHGGVLRRLPAVETEARPSSAGPRAHRPSAGLLPSRPNPQAEMAAQSVKRFLSRNCGTMQHALDIFDPNGDGYFAPSEWVDGLRRLDYMATYDVLEVFRIMDRRQHHVLTTSDLINQYPWGVSVLSGVPPPGIRGMASDILLEVLEEQFASVLHEALRDTLTTALMAPSGPSRDLPDMKQWLKRYELERKRQAKLEEKARKKAAKEARKEKLGSKDGTGEEGAGGSRPASPSGGGSAMKPTASGREGALPGRRKPKTGKKKGGSRGGSNSSRNPSPRSELSVSQGGKGRHPKHGKHGRAGSSAGTDRGGSTSSRGSKFKHKNSKMYSPGNLLSQRDPPSSGGTARGNKGASMLRSARSTSSRSTHSSHSPLGSMRGGSANRTSRLGGTGGRLGPWRASRMRTSGSLSGVLDSPRSEPSVGSGRGGHKQDKQGGQADGIDEGADSRLRNGGRRLGSQRRIDMRNSYTGYRFVEKPPPVVQDIPEDKLLPWVPRPVEEVCKTYSHIFRLLTDPRVRRMHAAPQKRSLHVSVPRMPTVGPHTSRSDGSGAATPEEEASEGELHAAEVNLESGVIKGPSTAGGGMANSKSTPGLYTGFSGVSTTAGTWPSAGSPATATGLRHSGRPRTLLPPLAATAPVAPARLPEMRTGLTANGIDAESRRGPAELLSGTL